MTTPRHLDLLGEQLFQELMKATPSALPRVHHFDDGRYVVGTHSGSRRSRNEDRVIIARIDPPTGPSYCLYLVCDGVGSSERGDEAAAVACASIVSYMSAPPRNTALGDLLTLAVRVADDTVRARLAGAGQTTLCAVLATNQRELVITSVGDSRVYSWGPNSDLIQLTEDDTLENEMRRLNLAGRSFVNERGLEGSLSQAIGEPGRSSEALVIRVTDWKSIPPGGIFMATDGVWVNNESAFQKVARNCPTAVELVRRALTSAYWMGGADNASGLAINDPQILPETLPLTSSVTRVTSWLPEQKLVLFRPDDRPRDSITPTPVQVDKKGGKNRKKKAQAAPGQLELPDSSKKAKLGNIIAEPDQD